MADHGTHLDKCFIVQRHIELLGRDIGAERSADLGCLDGPAGRGTSAPVFDQFAKRQAESLLDEAATLDIAGQLKRERAFRSVDPVCRILISTPIHNIGDRCQRHDVINDSRLLEQPGYGRQRRLVTNDARFALEALEHRCFLAADVRASAQVQFDVEIESTATDIAAEPARVARAVECLRQDFMGQWVFGSQVNVAAAGANREARDRHAFQQPEWIGFHQNTVGKGAAVAFIRIAGDVFLVRVGVGDSLPLDTGRKAGAAAAAQARIPDCLEHCGRPILKGFFERREPPVRPVVVDRQRLDQPAAPESPAILVDQVRYLVGGPDPLFVFTAGQQACRKQPGHVLRRDVSVSNALAVYLDLDEWLEPGRAPGAIADKLHAVAGFFCLAGDRDGNVVSADGDGRCLARDIDPGGRHRRGSCRVATISSNRSVLTRPYVLPSTIIAGEQAQLPRQ